MAESIEAHLVRNAQKLAQAIRVALESRAAVASADEARVRRVVSPSRIWPLAVILASWELSNNADHRPALNRLLGAAGVPAMWGSLDVMEDALRPFVVYAIDAQNAAQVAEAASRFWGAAERLGADLLEHVVESSPFKKAGRGIAQSLPEPREPVAAAAPDRTPASEILFVYLVTLGYSEARAHAILQGKKA